MTPNDVPQQEPTIMSTFLLRSYWKGSLCNDIFSVSDRIILSSAFFALKGAASFGVPHRAEPCSSPWRKCFDDANIYSHASTMQPTINSDPFHSVPDVNLIHGFASSSTPTPSTTTLHRPTALRAMSAASSRCTALIPS